MCPVYDGTIIFWVKRVLGDVGIGSSNLPFGISGWLRWHAMRVPSRDGTIIFLRD